ncbi:hypothetical protein A6A29_41265 [Streptomyces sp. TSRI0281]|nr:hypothetical protein A6A29_41265 [Streptomyces sp. TSRI0281]
MLDDIGVLDQPTRWPVDVTLRPFDSAERATLESVSPAGVLSARFTESLVRMNGGAHLADTYQAFLRRLDEETGIQSVEVLVPSLAERAANAVRRPLYTTAWTGDSDLFHYVPEPLRSGMRPAFLPLGQLEVVLNDPVVVRGLSRWISSMSTRRTPARL